MNVTFDDEEDIMRLQKMLKNNEFLENSSTSGEFLSAGSNEDKLSNLDSQKNLMFKNKLLNDEERSLSSQTNEF